MKLQINQLTKSYQDKIVLNQFDYIFQKGIYALLGNNGAGKTTLIKSICQLIEYDSGEIRFEFNGKKIYGKEILRYIGYMPQSQELYADFSVRQFMDYMATLKKMQNNLKTKSVIEEHLEKFDLLSVQDMKVRTLSGGTKQRLLLSQALLGNPPILLLDEPTVGLDFEQNFKFRNFLSEISRDHIIIIASHCLLDMERVANYCIFLKNGETIKIDRTADLITLLEGKVYERNCLNLEDMEEISKKNIVSSVFHEGNISKIRAISKGDKIEIGRAVQPTLEDVYLYYMSDLYEEN